MIECPCGCGGGDIYPWPLRVRVRHWWLRLWLRFRVRRYRVKFDTVELPVIRKEISVDDLRTLLATDSLKDDPATGLRRKS